MMNSDIISNTTHEKEMTDTLSATKPILLIAEDNPDNFKLYECILRKEYTLVHARNGMEAISFYKECTPDLVIMDIKMPVMDGYEAFEELKKVGVSVPVIAITAYAYASDEKRVRDAGFSGYITKPIQAHQLKDCIRDMIASR
ncbi:MAG: response regulator [Bacteroidales bacterium]